MGTGRRAAGRRGSCRPVGVSVRGSSAESTTRRQLLAISRHLGSNSNGQAAAVTFHQPGPIDSSGGRPMPELFGVRDIRESNYFNFHFWFSRSYYFLGIKFTLASESFGTSDSQWCDLARNTFLVYAGGNYVASRPRAMFEHPVLTVPFETRADFLEFLFQARQMSPTRLVGFHVEERKARCVICQADFNHTPALRVNGDTENLPPAGDDPIIIQL